MKNDKLFDMLTELKVDDEYIEEALIGYADNSDSRGIKVYAGKTQPMKIIAPIAACLAVFTAAGLVYANRDRLPINNSALSPASSSEESENTNTESTENSGTESTPSDSETKPVTYPDNVPIWDDTIFHRSCWDFISDKYADLLQGEITWWKEGVIDIDFDGEYESMVCAQVNHETVKGVDVCVFRRVGMHDIEYLGSLSSDFTEMYFDDIYFATDEANKCYYYFDCVEEYEKCTDTVRKIYFDKDANAVREEAYLQLVMTYPNDASSDTPYTAAAYRYGDEITTEQLFDEWSRIQKVSRDEEILPTPNLSDAHSGTDECVQLLVDKYGIPMSANSLHRVVQHLDINLDGTDETVIEFRNCEQLRGLYVFSSDGRLIGEFDPDCYRKQRWLGITGGMSTHTDESLFLYSENGERYYFYKTSHSGRNILSSWTVEEIYKIVVNGDGTLSAVAVLEGSYEDGYDSLDHFFINGKAVPFEEYRKEWGKYSDHLFPYVSRDPFVW